MESKDNKKPPLEEVLKDRFNNNLRRHPGLSWDEVKTRLDAQWEKWAILQALEDTGGEPDAVGQDPHTGKILYFDCAEESPKDRRSLCYDKDALESRKENRPAGSAVESAKKLGAELLSEQEYRHLQTLGEFDRKTSTWVLTPDEVRKRGGAIYCDRRYDRVFTYHNGAESYYGARGWRGKVEI